jgi:hypothetical protein
MSTVVISLIVPLHARVAARHAIAKALADGWLQYAGTSPEGDERYMLTDVGTGEVKKWGAPP